MYGNIRFYIFMQLVLRGSTVLVRYFFNVVVTNSNMLAFKLMPFHAAKLYVHTIITFDMLDNITLGLNIFRYITLYRSVA